MVRGLLSLRSQGRWTTIKVTGQIECQSPDEHLRDGATCILTACEVKPIKAKKNTAPHFPHFSLSAGARLAGISGSIPHIALVGLEQQRSELLGWGS